MSVNESDRVRAALAQALPAPPSWLAGVVDQALAGQKLDPAALARSATQALAGLASPDLAAAIWKDSDLQNALFALQHDVEATLAAIQRQDDPEKRENLVRDLDGVLVARRRAILSAARSRASGRAEGELAAVLDVLGKIVGAVARGLVGV